MPYKSISAAKKAGFPTSAEDIPLTLAQINKLAEIYDAIKKAGTAKNAFSVAWTAWKRLYKKTDHTWTVIKAASIQFGTEQFVAATGKEQGIPAHAAMIKGRLIKLDTKNLAGWGVTQDSAEQIVAGIPGVPIRACAAQDPHACDYAFDNRSHIGYGVRAWVADGWIMATAAITDKDAAKHIKDGTWTPLGKGGWSVAGLPTKIGTDFKKTGLIDGYDPTGISLVFAPAHPAFIGSGFDMVVAAITDHRGDDMTEQETDGGGNSAIYTQDALDKAVETALAKQKTEFDVVGNMRTAEELAKQKIEYDAAIAEMTVADRATFDAAIAEMTPNIDVEKMIAAAVTQGQTDTLEAIEKDKLMTEYEGMLTASVIGAPFQTGGVIDLAKLEAKMASVREMKVAAISSMIDEAKLLVAAASPGKSPFDTMPVSAAAPGTATQETQDMAVCDRMLGGI